jgi:hypothetical protein
MTLERPLFGRGLIRTGFWDAFWAGLACPTLLYPSRKDEKYQQIGRVDAAWKQAGGYIYRGVDSIADGADHRKAKRAK